MQVSARIERDEPAVRIGCVGMLVNHDL